MPIFTYSPHWEAVKNFYSKVCPVLPSAYTGLVGVRLHRTGNPLRLAVFGSKLPNSVPFPVVVIELKAGALVRGWDALETNFEVPWISREDFFHYSKNVMAFYQEEDKLEAVAEEILATDTPEEALLKQAVADTSAVPAS